MYRIKENRGFISFFLLIFTIGFTFQWWGPFFDGGQGVLSTAAQNISFLPGETTIAGVEGVWLGLSVAIALLFTCFAGAGVYCKRRIDRRDYEEIQDPDSILERAKRLLMWSSKPKENEWSDLYSINDLSPGDNNSIKTVYWEKTSSVERAQALKNPEIVKKFHQKFMQIDLQRLSNKPRIIFYSKVLKFGHYVENFLTHAQWFNIVNADDSSLLDAFDIGSKENKYVKEGRFIISLINDENFNNIPSKVTDRLTDLFSKAEFYNDENRALLAQKNNAGKFKFLILGAYFYNMNGEFLPAFLKAICGDPKMLYHVVMQYSGIVLHSFIDKLLLVIQKELLVENENRHKLARLIIEPGENFTEKGVDEQGFYRNLIAED